MDQPTDLSAARMRRDVDHELTLVREAILMVGRGGTLRVVVAGIRHGEALLPLARDAATGAGVRLLALPRADGAGADIAVERMNPVPGGIER
jgi:hypothetical protein